MSSIERMALKLECLKAVLESYKGENRSSEFLIQKANDLFEWLLKN